MKTKEYFNDIKKWIILIIVGLTFYWALNNINMLFYIINRIFKVFLPLILGGAIAYILNLPMKKIEGILEKNNKNLSKGVIRIISIILSLMIFIIIVLFIAFLFIPELIENIELLMTNIPNLINKIEVFILDLLHKYPDIQIQIKDLFSTTGNLNNIVSTILNYFINGALGFVTHLISGFVTLFTSIFFAIYMLSQKENLLSGCKKVIYALVNKNNANKILNLFTLTNKTFSKFISGQCVEAIILGLLIFVLSLIFRFPYALIIAILTSITALIPIFGALIACVIGAILICINNGIQAIMFVLIFLLVQQIEGNLIYPKVVGKSVGLSPLWTLLAITVGGNLFGVTGMILGIPLTSVIYTLVKEKIDKKLKTKNYKNV